MHEPIILQHLAQLERAARRATVPAGLVERLAQVGRRSQLLTRLRGRAGPEQEMPPAEATERVLTLPEIPVCFRRIVEEAEAHRVDTVLRDYLATRAPHIAQLAADPDQRRGQPRRTSDQRVILDTDARPVAAICQDRSAQGFGLWAAEAPDFADDEVVRVLMDDPVGYECFVAYRTALPAGGFRIGLEFPGNIETDPVS